LGLKSGKGKNERQRGINRWEMDILREVKNLPSWNTKNRNISQGESTSGFKKKTVLATRVQKGLLEGVVGKKRGKKKEGASPTRGERSVGVNAKKVYFRGKNGC